MSKTEKNHAHLTEGLREMRQQYGILRSDLAAFLGVEDAELKELEDEEIGTDHLREQVLRVLSMDIANPDLLRFWREQCRKHRLALLTVLSQLHGTLNAAHLSMYAPDEQYGTWRLDLKREQQSLANDSLLQQYTKKPRS